MRAMRAPSIPLLALVLVCTTTAGCSDDGGGDGGSGPSDPSFLDPIEHDFPAVPLQPGEEITSLCLSWSIGNEAPLFVNGVTMHAGPGWHHSNWFYVPEGTFPVDDGVWPCSDAGFNQLAAAQAGGVLFAQSTQATDETQTFPQGAALEIPPASVVVSQIHLLNSGDGAIDTGVSMTLAPMAEAEVEIRLHPLAFDFHQLAIPPQQRSRFEAECDMEASLGGPLDAISLYYVLPHYHARAEGMDIQIFGGERDGERIYRVESGIGEPLGATLSPPFSLAGARGIRFSCTYDNRSEATIGYGNSGQAEMCIFLAFTDSALSWAGGVVNGQPSMRGVEDGVAVFTGPCGTVALPTP